MQTIIEQAWENRELLKDKDIVKTIHSVIDLLDNDNYVLQSQKPMYLAGKRLGKKGSYIILPYYANANYARGTRAILR